MKSKKENQLEHKYLEGEASLAEEQEFLRRQDTPFNGWSAYRAKNHYPVPDKLIDNIADELDRQVSKSRKFYLAWASAAASIALVILLLFANSLERELSYEEKAAKLEEILNALPENKTTNEILYEDALVVIYVESK
jgi:hypothetical protein